MMKTSSNFILEIPTLTGTEWSTTTFTSRLDFITFVSSQIKEVGNYNLKDTFKWRSAMITFKETGHYCKFVKKSKSFIDFWEFEKLKSKVGVIIDGRYITEHYYFYLNFCPIYDVLEQQTTPPEVWDSHYDYTLRAKHAELLGEHLFITKKRRWGYSFLEVADIHRLFIFERKAILKFFCIEDDPNEKNFRILESYREFTNLNTAWYRSTMGTYPKIEQKIERVDVLTKKKQYTGRKSILECVATKMNPAKGVGLYLTKGLWDEAGINRHLIKSIQYNEKSVKQGGVVKGKIRAGGSVGELKDCESLKELMYKPKEYGGYTVEQPDGSKTGLFIPETSNYVSEVRNEEGLVIDIKKFYDEDGNSFVEEAKAEILKMRLEEKDKSPEAYRLSISQGPLTLGEAFDEREENIFPTHIINPEFTSLFAVKEKLGIPIELMRVSSGGITHRIVNSKKVWDFPVEKHTDREAVITMYEPPVHNPPLGLYYAGIDPIGTKKALSTNTKSLMSCYIMKARHEMEDQWTEKVIVAELTCRYDDYEKTYGMVADLCEFYNARPLVENNNENYIGWLIANKRHKLLIRKSELTNLKEVSPNYNSLANYGVSMNTDLKNHLLDSIVTYVENPVSKEWDESTGKATPVYGVNLIKDPMLLKEMLKWTPKLNTDRLIAFGLALWAVTVFSEQKSRRVKTRVEESQTNVVKRRRMFSGRAPQFRSTKMF